MFWEDVIHTFKCENAFRILEKVLNRDYRCEWNRLSFLSTAQEKKKKKWNIRFSHVIVQRGKRKKTQWDVVSCQWFSEFRNYSHLHLNLLYHRKNIIRLYYIACIVLYCIEFTSHAWNRRVAKPVRVAPTSDCHLAGMLPFPEAAADWPVLCRWRHTCGIRLHRPADDEGVRTVSGSNPSSQVKMSLFRKFFQDIIRDRHPDGDTVKVSGRCRWSTCLGIHFSNDRHPVFKCRLLCPSVSW